MVLSRPGDGVDPHPNESASDNITGEADSAGRRNLFRQLDDLRLKTFLGLAERESQQARAQQHKAGSGQCKEAIRDNVVVAHVTPATLDARPNLLKLSESPIASGDVSLRPGSGP
jgi:hypothetical protein